MFLVVIFGGMLVYGLISMMVAAMIWMFTTVFGLIVLGLFVLMVLGNLFNPPDQEDEDDE